MSNSLGGCRETGSDIFSVVLVDDVRFSPLLEIEVTKKPGGLRVLPAHVRGCTGIEPGRTGHHAADALFSGNRLPTIPGRAEGVGPTCPGRLG